MVIPDVELVDVESLLAHPRNYRGHPDDQVEHIAQSIQQHGVYRNVVVARDSTILAGHGVVKAAKKLGLEKIRAVRLDVDPQSPQALKLLAGDNEVGRLAMIDDRELSELLKEVKTLDEYGLVGTGFDDMMLANLAMVTRPASEIADINESAEWLGMPDYVPRHTDMKYVVNFRTAEQRTEFAKKFGLMVGDEEKLVWSTRWPNAEREDLASVKYSET